MGIKTKLLKQMRTSLLWGEREIRIGRVSILACDLGLSINLLRKRSPSELRMATLTGSEVEEYTHTYGVVLEPFLLSVMGSNGDICWQSPGVDLTTKLCKAASMAEENDHWINFADLMRQKCHIQGRHGVDYIFGDHGYPCCGQDLRFRDPSKSFCGESNFIPKEGDGQVDYWQLADNCHSLEIHREDAPEFVRRINDYRNDLCLVCVEGCSDYPLCKIGR